MPTILTYAWTHVLDQFVRPALMDQRNYMRRTERYHYFDVPSPDGDLVALLARGGEASADRLARYAPLLVAAGRVPGVVRYRGIFTFGERFGLLRTWAPGVPLSHHRLRMRSALALEIVRSLHQTVLALHHHAGVALVGLGLEHLILSEDGDVRLVLPKDAVGLDELDDAQRASLLGADRARLVSLYKELTGHLLDRPLAPAPRPAEPPSAPDWPPRPGDRCGDYRVIDVLHRGPANTLLAAEHATTGAPRVLKCPVQGAPRASERLRREMGLLTRLALPALPTGYGIQWTNGRGALVMERVEGRSLRDLMVFRDLAVWEVVRVLQNLALALCDLHRWGILHGDVQPEHVMVGPDLQVTLVGLALADAPGDPRPQADLGAAGYAAPEALRGAPRPRSEVWSWGAIAYEALSEGAPLFPRASADAIRQAIDDGFVGGALARWGAELPAHLVGLIRTALSVNANTRPTSEQLVAALVDWAGLVEPAEPSDGPFYLPPPRPAAGDVPAAVGLGERAEAPARGSDPLYVVADVTEHLELEPGQEERDACAS